MVVRAAHAQTLATKSIGRASMVFMKPGAPFGPNAGHAIRRGKDEVIIEREISGRHGCHPCRGEVYAGIFPMVSLRSTIGNLISMDRPPVGVAAAVTPAGVRRMLAYFRWYRYAQPPANLLASLRLALNLFYEGKT